MRQRGAASSADAAVHSQLSQTGTPPKVWSVSVLSRVYLKWKCCVFAWIFFFFAAACTLPSAVPCVVRRRHSLDESLTLTSSPLIFADKQLNTNDY